MRRWLAIALGIGSLALIYGLTTIEVGQSNIFTQIIYVIAFVSPSLVGTYLGWRVPDNPIGLILAGFGFSFLLGVTGETLAGTESPLATWGAWFGTWQWALSMVLLLVLLPLFFPDGRLPSRRSRWIIASALAGLSLLIIGNAFRPSLALGDEGTFPSPIALPLSNATFDVIATLGMVLALIAIMASLTLAVVRYRRSVGVQRQQMKVFAGAILFAAVGGLVNLVAYEAGLEELGNTIFALLVIVVMAAIAVAVLRYRLYDLGRLVSRTVSYAIVAAIVVGTYALVVFAAASFASGSSSNITVALATLVAAAVFRPALRRVRTLVDRQFNREKYDAQQTIDSFGARMRLETDLEDLTIDLAAVVQATMRPDQLRVWLAG